MRFEEILAKLRKVNEELECEDVPLERAVELYEEGMRLSRMADEMLANAETRIRQLEPEK